MMPSGAIELAGIHRPSAVPTSKEIQRELADQPLEAGTRAAGKVGIGQPTKSLLIITQA
jgi:hypothetical protein